MLTDEDAKSCYLEHSEQFGDSFLLSNSFLKSKKFFVSQDSALAVFLR